MEDPDHVQPSQGHHRRRPRLRHRQRGPHRPAVRAAGQRPPGAATEDAIDPCTTPILYVSRDIIWGSEEPGTENLISEGGHHARGQVYVNTMDLDDDRLDGPATTTLDWDISGSPTSEDSIHRGTLRIENEAGAWEGPFTGFGQYQTLRNAGYLSGSGAYEGLSAMLLQVGFAGSRAPIEGAIYPTDIGSCDFSAG